MKDNYTTFDIVAARNIPRERLKDWMSNGFISVSIPAQGKGTKALFTRLDVYALELFRHLHEGRHYSRIEASRFVKCWLDYVGIWVGANRYDQGRGAAELGEKAIAGMSGIRVDSENPEKTMAEFVGAHPVFCCSGDNLQFFPHSIFGQADIETINSRLGSVVERLEEDLSTGNWDDIIMVNFKKIMDDVDHSLDLLDT